MCPLIINVGIYGDIFSVFCTVSLALGIKYPTVNALVSLGYGKDPPRVSAASPVLVRYDRGVSESRQLFSVHIERYSEAIGTGIVIGNRYIPIIEHSSFSVVTAIIGDHIVLFGRVTAFILNIAVKIEVVYKRLIGYKIGYIVCISVFGSKVAVVIVVEIRHVFRIQRAVEYHYVVKHSRERVL